MHTFKSLDVAITSKPFTAKGHRIPTNTRVRIINANPAEDGTPQVKIRVEDTKRSESYQGIHFFASPTDLIPARRGRPPMSEKQRAAREAEKQAAKALRAEQRAAAKAQKSAAVESAE